MFNFVFGRAKSAGGFTESAPYSSANSCRMAVLSRLLNCISAIVYMIAADIRIMPSARFRTPSHAMAINTSAVAIMTGTSSLMLSKCNGRGRIRALNPSMNRMLKILVPAMLPMASVPLPSVAAVIPTANSGMLVPTETIVSPIIIGFILSSVAICEAPRSNNSAPTMMMTSPARKVIEGCGVIVITGY